jgi:hypothetical protein
MARRKDASIAVFATARKLGEMLFRMLRYGQHYVDVGQAEYEKRYEQTQLRALQSRAKQMGYQIVRKEPLTA